METDESIFEIPHVTTIFQTNDAFDTNKLLSTLFVSLFSETKRRGHVSGRLVNLSYGPLCL
jgi:hypothetical protein